MWQGQGAAYAAECALKDIASEDCSLFNKLIDDFRNANAFWLVVISLCFITSNILRSERWKMLLYPLGYEPSSFNAFAAVQVSYFANLGVPRIGEFVRAGLISRYEKIPVEKAMATIVVGRGLDFILLFVFILLGLLFRFDAIWGYTMANLDISIETLMISGVVLIIATLVGLFLLKKMYEVDTATLHPLLGTIKDKIIGFIEALKSVKNLPNIPLFIAYSIGIWVMYYLMTYLAFYAYDPVSHLGPLDGLLVFDFGSLGMVFPSPGGMGSYHYMIVEALKILNVDPINGFTFAIITFFTLTISCTVIIGLLCLILLPLINKQSS
jgi:conserved hypothetical protein